MAASAADNSRVRRLLALPIPPPLTRVDAIRNPKRGHYDIWSRRWGFNSTRQVRPPSHTREAHDTFDAGFAALVWPKLQSYNSNPPIQKRNLGKTRKARIQMITPRLALRGYLAVMILLVLIAGLAIAQAPKAAGTAKKWTPPHTPWGDPDLQGIWSNSTITPIERPKELGEKEFLTDDQETELEKRAAQSRVDSPPPKGDPGTYNQFWFERGNKVVPTKRTSLIVDTPDGRLPPLTPDGEKRDQERFRRLGPDALGSSGNGPFDSWEDISVVTRCITRGLPNAMIPGAYNNNFQIVQSPGFVALFSEMMHETRIISLDGRSHIDAGIHQWMGDSRGHWEGNSLVVDVTNFRDND